MRVTILQISEDRNKKRVLYGKESLIGKPYSKYDFDLNNYMVSNIKYNFWDIQKSSDEKILEMIKENFKSFYTFDGRESTGIIVSDLVTIGRRMYYYNLVDGEEKWAYIGKAPITTY